MLVGISVSGFAENKPDILEEDTISIVKESLDPNQYAGLYMENGDLHIIATDKHDLSSPLTPLLVRNADANIVIDE